MTGLWEQMVSGFSAELDKEPIKLPFYKFYKAIYLGILTKRDGRYYWAGSEVIRE